MSMLPEKTGMPEQIGEGDNTPPGTLGRKRDESPDRQSDLSSARSSSMATSPAKAAIADRIAQTHDSQTPRIPTPNEGKSQKTLSPIDVELHSIFPEPVEVGALTEDLTKIKLVTRSHKANVTVTATTAELLHLVKLHRSDAPDIARKLIANTATVLPEIIEKGICHFVLTEQSIPLIINSLARKLVLGEQDGSSTLNIALTARAIALAALKIVGNDIPETRLRPLIGRQRETTLREFQKSFNNDLKELSLEAKAFILGLIDGLYPAMLNYLIAEAQITQGRKHHIIKSIISNLLQGAVRVSAAILTHGLSEVVVQSGDAFVKQTQRQMIGSEMKGLSGTVFDAIGDGIASIAISEPKLTVTFNKQDVQDSDITFAQLRATHLHKEYSAQQIAYEAGSKWVRDVALTDPRVASYSLITASQDARELFQPNILSMIVPNAVSNFPGQVTRATKQGWYATTRDAARRLANSTKARKAEPDYVLAMVSADGEALEHALPNFQRDKKYVRAAVAADARKDPELQFWEGRKSVFQFASDDLRSDKDFILELVKLDYRVAEFMSSSLLEDLEFLERLAAVDADVLELENIPTSIAFNESILLAAIKQSAAAFLDADPGLQKDLEFIEKAVKVNPKVYGFVILADEALAKNQLLRFVKLAPGVLGPTPEEWLDEKLCIDAVEANPEAIEFLLDDELLPETSALSVVKHDGLLLEHLPSFDSNVEVCKAAIDQNPFALFMCDPGLRIDPGMVLRAARGNPDVLKDVHIFFREEEHFMRSLMTDPAKIPSYFAYAGPELQTNLSFVVDMAKRNGEVIRAVNPDFLVRHPEVVTEAVLQNYRVFVDAPESLRQNKEYVEDLMRKHPQGWLVLRKAHTELQSDPGLQKLAQQKRNSYHP